MRDRRDGRTTLRENLEASPGIEPGYTDLQSAASPFRHEALADPLPEPMPGDKAINGAPGRLSRNARLLCR